jgi:plasmid stabilization system protein ParE
MRSGVTQGGKPGSAREIVKSPRAREDLIGISRYTFAEWGEVQADRYLAEMDSGRLLGATFPAGHGADDLFTL